MGLIFQLGLNHDRVIDCIIVTVVDKNCKLEAKVIVHADMFRG